MRIKEIEQTGSREFPMIWDAQVGDAGTTKIAAAFVTVNGSTLVQSDVEPQALCVYLGQVPVSDFRDIEICDVGFNPQAGTKEWVVNITCCGLIPVSMDYFDTIPTICEMLRNSVPILDIFNPAQAIALDAEITCKSLFIADYLDMSSRFFSRPDAI